MTKNRSFSRGQIQADARRDEEILEDRTVNQKLFTTVEEAYEYFQSAYSQVSEGEIDILEEVEGVEYVITFPEGQPRTAKSFDSLIDQLAFGVGTAWIQYHDRLEKDEKPKTKKVLKEFDELWGLRAQGLI